MLSIMMNMALLKDYASVIQIIDGLGFSRTCSEVASELNLVWTHLQEQGNDMEAALVDYERQACLLTLSSSIVRSFQEDPTEKQERFTGLVTYADGSQWPDPNGFSTEAFEHLRQRALTTANPVLKARYGDLLFEKSKVQARHRLALAAIDAYLECTEGFSTSTHISHQFEVVSAFDQATTLAMKLRCKEKVSEIIPALLQMIERQAAEEDSGVFVLDLSRILLYIRASRKYGKLVADADVQRVQAIANTLVDRNKGLPFGERDFLGIASMAAHFLQQPEEEFQTELRAGEALVRQGDASQQQSGNGPRHLVAVSFYENAVQHYQQMRERFPDMTPPQREDLLRRESSLKNKIREMYRAGRNEFGRFEVPITVPKDELERMLDELLDADTLQDCLHRIATERSLLPNLENARNTARMVSGDNPLLSLFTKRSIRNDMTVAVAQTEEEKYQAEVDRQVLLWIQLNSSIVLTQLVDRLKEQKGLSATTLTKYLASFGIFPDENLEIIGEGIERYFSDDFVSALHVLVPQFEDVLRTLFERGGLGVIRTKKRQVEWEAESFGSFLEQPFVKRIFRADMLIYFQLVMTKSAGWNLRNEIAHGLIRKQECNPITAVTVLHLYLLLTLFRLEEKGDASPC